MLSAWRLAQRPEARLVAAAGHGGEVVSQSLVEGDRQDVREAAPTGICSERDGTCSPWPRREDTLPESPPGLRLLCPLRRPAQSYRGLEGTARPTAEPSQVILDQRTHFHCLFEERASLYFRSLRAEAENIQVENEIAEVIARGLNSRCSEAQTEPLSIFCRPYETRSATHEDVESSEVFTGEALSKFLPLLGICVEIELTDNSESPVERTRADLRPGAHTVFICCGGKLLIQFGVLAQRDRATRLFD